MPKHGFELRILGPVEAIVGGRSIALGGRRQRAVLARLALSANQVVGTDQLIDDLWGDDPPVGVRNTLQTYVARLRRLLSGADGPGRIATAGHGYRLELDPRELDAAEAERQIAEARVALETGSASEAATLFASALARWRGPPLVDLGDLPWVIGERARLEDLRASALEGSGEAALGGGEPERAAEVLATLTGEQPLRERSWELLMEALYRSGRQADALDAFHRIRRHLAEDLGLDPGPGLRTQEARILRHDPSLMPAPAAATVPGAASMPRPEPSRLPLQRTSFVGRTRELEELAGEVRRSPLVTVVGVGGSGKTRLAVQLAGRFGPGLADGAWFVSLERTSDGSAVSRLAAEALGVREEAGRNLELTIADAIGERELLLLLDNCEHLIEAASTLAESLTTRCPRLRILATSREPLAVPGEHVFALGSMALPEAAEPALAELLRSDAARLFVERAAHASPEFALRQHHATDLARLLRRLDGLPLAVELAATRVRSLGLPQILHQLDAGDGDLGAVQRTSAERHRSLRATVDWSYRLLTRPEQRTLARLAAFAGPFRAEDAVAVCGDEELPAREVTALLGSLVDRSLVVRADQPDAADASYRLLDTIRRFGVERLEQGDDADVVRGRHARHFTGLAERGFSGLIGAHQLAWLHRLDEASADLATALDWLVAQRQSDVACRLTASLRLYWEMRGHMTEGLAWIGRALAIGDGSASSRALALIAGADLATGIGEHQEAEGLVRQACEQARGLLDAALAADVHHVHGLLGKYQGQYRRATVELERSRRLSQRAGRLWHVAQSLHHLGMVKGYQGRYTEARRLHEDSLTIYRSLGDADSLGAALRSLSVIAIDEGDYERAESLTTESLAISERAESVMNVAHARYTLGDVRRLRGDMASADALYERSVGELRTGGDRRCVASTLRNRGLVALVRGDVAAARAYMDESLAVRTDLDDRAGIAESMEGLAQIAAGENDIRAAELLGAAEAIRAAIGAARARQDAAAITAVEQRLRASLGKAAFVAARRRGAELEPPSAKHASAQ